MKFYLSLALIFCGLLFFSQESLEPLRTNFKLFDNDISNRSQLVQDLDFIYLTDTINLPIIDDFSTNKFKSYSTDTGLSNVYDSTWYYLSYLDGNLVPDTVSYMSNPTFTNIYDSVNLNGVDTLILNSYENSPDTLIVSNLSFYPILSDTIILWPNITVVDSTWTTSNPDLIFSSLNPDYEQDSISLYFVKPVAEDFSKVWLDNDVFLNNNYPKNPYTIGVVTFDGLNSSGQPYNWNTGAVDWSDYLTSKPIFLGQKDISDSIYLSFFFQSGGYGETPDSTDSLAIQFFNPSNENWSTIWSINGFESDQWYYEHILLDSIKYFQDGFKFRFKSYGSLTGSLDHWNLDYVYFNENRSFNDTLMQDWAFVSPPITMLNNYSSVPWKHFKNSSSNILLDKVTIPSYNSSNNPKLVQPCFMDLFYKDSLQSSFPYSASVLNVPNLSFFDMEYDFGSNFTLDKTINDTFVDFKYRFYIATNTTPERLSENDTIYHNQTFQNYYSYDDGSAEAGYGIIGNGVELAYRFSILDGMQSDTLRSVKIHFSPTVNDVSNEPFFLQIWDDSLGLPGNLIYTSDDINFPEIFYPQYNSGLNGFFEYELPSLIPVSDTFYIGWKQITSSRLNVGFDKNVNRRFDIFYNLGSGFQNTIFEGSLMMRPVFISDMDNFVNFYEHKFEKSNVSLFPNPADQIVNISNNDVVEIIIYDLNARVIFRSNILNDFSFNVKDFYNGIYLVDIKFNNGDSQVKKLIVHHRL